MKIVAISDLHGFCPTIIEKFDILLICGDVCPVWNHSREYQWNWLNDDFINWVNNLPFKDVFSRVIMIAGNHDFIFENFPSYEKREWLSKLNNRVVYLDNEEYIFNDGEKDYRIFGTPYCKVFGNWAFMRENLNKYFDAIPEGLDFLISHDAPMIDNYGIIREGRWTGENAGNKPLADAINRAKPKYAFHGHIHSSNHEMKEIDGTNIACVSIMNEKYEPLYLPLILNV